MGSSLAVNPDVTELSDLRPVPAIPWLISMVLVAAVACGFATFLAWSTLQIGDIVGCEPNGKWDCSHVTKTKWSAVGGIPVSLPGAVTYAAIVLILLGMCGSRSIRSNRWANGSVVCGAWVAVLCGIYFTALQYFVIEKWCKWCLVVHGMGTLLFLLMSASRMVSVRQFAQWGALAATSVAAMMLAQYVSDPPQTFLVERFDAPAIDAPAIDAPALDAPALDAPSLDDSTFLDAPADIIVLDAPSDAPRTPAPALGETLVLDAPAETTNPSGIANETMTLISAGPSADQAVTSPPTVMDERQDVGTTAVLEAPIEVDPVGEESIAVEDGAVPFPSLSPVPQEVQEDESQPQVADASAAQPAADAQPTPPRRVIQFGGQNSGLKLNILNRPILGSVKAPVVFLELFDYTCPHCRETNKHIRTARQWFGDQLAFVVLPVPLASECNPEILTTQAGHQDACEISRIAIGVWKLAPDAFPDFHDWLCEPVQGRTAAEARLQAETLVDAAELSQVLSSRLVSDFINQHVQVYRLVQKGALPQLFSERIKMVGLIQSSDQLTREITRAHEIRPLP